MDLVERDEVLTHLRAELTEAKRRTGRLVFLAGTAGVGKTSVVRTLGDQTRGEVRLLWGACDALSTPRALGPLHDMGEDVPTIADLPIGATPRHAVFSAFLDELARRPSLVIVEDVHWADEATLDLLVFLGRRIDRTRSLVIATYRADEIDPGHPLRPVLGDLATAPGHRRVVLEPLTLDGVRQLASVRPVDPEHLFDITGGNPFYVTEVLAAPGWTVPPTVTDAVLARARRQSDDIREVLEAMSVEPGPMELSLLGDLGHDSQSIEGALRSGMVVSDQRRATFRHELARLALESVLSSEHRRRLHAQILSHLDAQPVVEPARLAHHASRAGDDRALLRWAPEAGQVAADSGAHREAVVHYRDAVAAADRGHVDDEETLVRLLEAYAWELSIVDVRSATVEVRERIVDIVTRLGDVPGAIMARTQLAYALWRAGDGQAARDLIAAVVEDAIRLGDDHVAAHAHAGAGYLAMLARSGRAAVEHCTRAVELAENGPYDEVLVRALNALGSARICSFDDVDGIGDLERSARIASARGWDAPYADAWENLGSGLGEIRRYGLAVGYLEKTIGYAIERDLDGQARYSRAWLSRVRFEQGRWDEAVALARSLSSVVEISPISPIVALTVLARVRTRRGDPGIREPLETAWRLALDTGDLQRLWPVAAARAEDEWLAGGVTDDTIADVRRVLEMAVDLDVSWAIGEVGFWAWKLGLIEAAPAGAAEPYRLHVEGDHHAAARAWEELGCPYEQAWALAEAADEDSLRASLGILHDLGAGPLADGVRQALRELGSGPVPTGPRPATAAHPAGLTPRQVEVLDLLCEGLTNTEIADRLYISSKTAGHHVSAILRKLEVSNRAQAAAHANAMGWHTR